MNDWHNASHRPLPYFEWHYFHFVTKEGVTINMVLHETDILGQKSAPYLSMSILLPGKSPFYLRRNLPMNTIARDQEYLLVIDPIIIEDRDGITFEIHFPGRGHFQGKITKLAPPLAFQDSILYRDIVTGQGSHWVVQVPHGAFTGLLQLGSNVYHLRGMAYQDHQWGSTLLQESIADWVWGHFSNEHMAILFFQILTRHGQKIERVALQMAEGRFMGTVLETNFLPMLFTQSKPDILAESIALSFFGESLHLDFDLSPNKLMRKRLSENHGQREISYLRWAGRGVYQGPCDRGPLYGISEYIRVRPVAYAELLQREHCEHLLRYHDGDLIGDSHSLHAPGAPAGSREGGG